jgi:hypothetical protein
VRFGVIGLETHVLAVLGDRPVQVALKLERDAQIEVRVREIRLLTTTRWATGDHTENQKEFRYPHGAALPTVKFHQDWLGGKYIPTTRQPFVA